MQIDHYRLKGILETVYKTAGQLNYCLEEEDLRLYRIHELLCRLDLVILDYQAEPKPYLLLENLNEEGKDNV